MACDESFNRCIQREFNKACPERNSSILSEEVLKGPHQLMGSEVCLDHHGEEKKVLEGVTKIEFREGDITFHTVLGEMIRIRSEIEKARINKNGCLFFVTILLMFMITVPGKTFAQGVDEEKFEDKSEEVQTLEDVVVRGRALDLTGIAETASEGIVGMPEFSARAFLRPGEILETVPGVIITQHSGTGKANQFFLRGFNLDHGTDFSATMNGMPLNMPTHGHGQGWLDLNFLIPEIIDSIEYKKGPYSAEVGDFSSAGATFMRLADTLPHGIAQIGIGEDNYRRLLLADSPRVGGGNLLYALALNTFDGPWVLPENLKRYNGVMRYSFGNSQNKFHITGMAYQADWDSTDQIPKRAVESGRISRLDAIDKTVGGETERFSLSGEWEGRGEHGVTDANLYLVYSSLDLFSNFTLFLEDPVNGDQFEQVDKRIIFGGAASHQWLTAWGGFDVDNTIGLQVRNDFISEVGLHATKERARLSTVREDEVIESSAAIYASNEVLWMDKFRSIVGLRGDLFYFDVDSDLPANSGSEVDGIISPKLGFIAGPWSKTEYYLNLGLGYHSNDARGTTITQDPKTLAPAEKVDALVRSKGAEIGIRTTAIPNLNSTLSLWILELDSEILFVGDAGFTEPSRPSRRYGVEWANFYKPTSWLTLDADLSLSKARFRDSDPAGDYIPGAIETVVAAGASVETPDDYFGSVRVRHFGKRPLIEDNSVRSDPTTLVNLRLGKRFKNDISLVLAILNLLDSKDSNIDYFYASRLKGEPAEGVEDIHFHPTDPRTVRVDLVWNF